jgi:parvulin-like peptidyl-prolyl isomerase
LPGAGGSVWITRDSPLPGEVLDAAFGQPIGEIGPLIETLLGCHVVLVSERRDAERLSFLEVRDVIRARLMNQRRESEVPALVRRLRDQAIIRNP